MPIRQKGTSAAAEPGTAGLEVEISLPVHSHQPWSLRAARVGARGPDGRMAELGKRARGAVITQQNQRCCWRGSECLMAGRGAGGTVSLHPETQGPRAPRGTAPGEAPAHFRACRRVSPTFVQLCISSIYQPASPVCLPQACVCAWVCSQQTVKNKTEPDLAVPGVAQVCPVVAAPRSFLLAPGPAGLRRGRVPGSWVERSVH